MTTLKYQVRNSSIMITLAEVRLMNLHSHIAMNISRKCLAVKQEVLGHHIQCQTGTPVRNGTVQLRVAALLLLMWFLSTNQIHLLVPEE